MILIGRKFGKDDEPYVLEILVDLVTMCTDIREWNWDQNDPLTKGLPFPIVTIH